MRRLLRLIGSRYGISLAAVVVVAAIVLVARALGGGDRPPPTGDPDQRGAATASYEPDDGEDSPAPVESPSTSPGAADPTAVALAFAQAWLHHDGVSSQQWFDGLAKYVTDDLREQLTGVDPAGVPANSVTGDPTLAAGDRAYAQVTIPVDSGVLSLRLLATNGRWLVDGVDWERS